MNGAAQRYQEILEDLLLDRELASGALPQEIEARFAGELDRCWQAMTDEEQDEAERRFAEEFVPPVSQEPQAKDVVVQRGDRSAPRRAA